MVLLIAALHALPIFFIAWYSNNRAWVWLVAIVSGAIALSTGNPTYAFADLLAIGIALWNCLEVIKRRTNKAHAREPSEPQVVKKPIDIGRWIGALILVALFASIFASIFLESSPRHSSASAEPPPSIAIPTPTVASPAQENLIPSPETHEQHRLTVEQCLRIGNEHKMTQCLERAP